MNKFFLIALISVTIGGVFWLTQTIENSASSSEDELKFSNTQTWDPELNKVITESQNDATTKEYLSKIHLPPPPPNTATTTSQELLTLHILAENERTKALQEIEAEIYTKNLRLGNFIYGNNDKPSTTRLLEEARIQLLPVVMTLKQDFDRVRPTYLDPTLTTAIPVPAHPAYPSGHATEARLMANLLSKLDPTQAKTYQNDAIRIARNREIAGVHYPSDSEAGRSLADQFTILFLETDDGKKLFQQALIEWN